MRILIDTNILFSAVLFPESKVAKTLIYIIENHKLVLCDYIIYELKEIIKRKKPELIKSIDILLTDLSYELIQTPSDTKNSIRDINDLPILNAAIASNVDIILTGDKDFLTLDLN
ncbi:MAG TPA: putative toxin-antitoxin system toxin component, PIN family [Clostridia bacterium]|jgi:putative PIN family toxin of toxin-antitoxin system|nr:MAG: hypothetical protein BWX97_01506 [Firmicutes bacterium ADurb.Bin146]HOD93471.1 putative toxin-antitoxin system toxin component, PIN family [Clostridia bacterium]HQM39765.1 putative toxin-antitoxin system toxin component, PIN family [Clostridia bacterium]